MRRRSSGKVWSAIAPVALLMAALLLQACVNNPATPTLPSPNPSLPTASGQVSTTAALSPEPPLLVVVPTRTARPTPTEAVREDLGSTTPLEKPISLNDVYRRQLDAQGYELVSAMSTRSASGTVYSAYLFQYNYDVTDPHDLGPADPCRLAVYRWDGKLNRRIFETPGPGYPEGGYFPAGGKPVYCDAYGFREPTEPDAYQEAYRALHFDGYWSDINENGLPEFYVDYWYCFNACGGYPEGATHFYEIQDVETVVDITEDLPGFINWWRLNSVTPTTFYVDDPSHVYAPHYWIPVSWIYQWDGSSFVDVTLQYADEYVKEGDELAAEWQAKQGQPFQSSFDVLTLLKIPLLYEKAGRTEEGLDRFRDLTSLAHWPATEPEIACWLKETNEQFRADYEAERPLSLGFYLNLYLAGPLPENCQD